MGTLIGPGAWSEVRKFVVGARPGALGLLALVTLPLAVVTTEASAVPSFARQTGQPCASCHSSFPQLTPFGRRFKIGGYTLEGGDEKVLGSTIPPVAAVLQATFTEYARKLDAPTGTYAPPSPNGGFPDNHILDPWQQVSLFYAGKIVGNLGAFIQVTLSTDYGQGLGLDLTDIRYADTGQIGALDFIYGITLNNVPSVQDPWNTTPVWRFPWIVSSFALSPASSTMIESFGSSQTVGLGGYVFAHDLVYVELAGYGSLTPATQTTLGSSPPALADTIDGVAPYWRLAIEPNWGDNSWMIGTFGMAANILPNRTFGVGTDKITDIGVDTQYQWISDVNAITVRASYIYEKQLLDATYYNLMASANPSNWLSSLNVSATYVYDNMISLTGAFFRLAGSADAIAYANNANFSPNSQGWIVDLAYMPFSHGAPGPWPWFNAKIGIQYNWWTRFDGGTSDIDPVQCPGCRSARDNNTLLLYAWLAF